MTASERESAIASRDLADLYSVLGLDPGADEEDLRIAYRRLAMRYHPDGSRDPSTARQFSRIVKAYKILSARAPAPPAAPAGTRDRYRGALEAGEDLFALGQVILVDPDRERREAAVRRLGLSGRSAAYVFVRRAFYDEDEDVALAAVRAAALLGSRQAEGEVAALYSRASPALRRRIVETARATKERLFRATLAAARNDPDPVLATLARRLDEDMKSQG